MNEALRILVVDDNEMMAKTLKDILKVKNYQVEVAYSGPEALDKLERERFGCVLSDIKMPDVNGVDLYRVIKTRQPQLPVVLMTAYATDRLIEEGLDEGAIAVLTKPLNIGALLNFLSFMEQKRSVVIIDDDPGFCQTTGDILKMHDFIVKQVINPDDVLGKLEAAGEVVLLDMKLDDGKSGLDVLREIKQKHPRLPVVLVTGYREEVDSVIESSLEAGAFTCVYKPLKVEKLLDILTEIHHQQLGWMLGHPSSSQRRVI